MVAYWGYQPSVPWVPTRDEVIRQLLRILRPAREMLFYDVGCGDGRVAVAVAEAFPVLRIRCIELRRDLAEKARKAVREKGLENRVEVIEADFFTVPLRDADIVYLYLLTTINQRLRPKLEEELRDGTVVISLDFPIPGWSPYATVELPRVWQKVFYIYVKGLSDRQPTPAERERLEKAAAEKLNMDEIKRS